MKIVSDTLRLARFLLSVPVKAVHWASFQVVSGATEWYPLEVIAKGSKFALLILNQPIAFSKDTATMIWNRGNLSKMSSIARI